MNKSSIAMEEETTDFYYFGMVLPSKIINTIAYLLRFGRKEYKKIQDKSFLPDMSLIWIGRHNYQLAINATLSPFSHLNLD